jgi:dTDP-glucose pyrophosphorylase
LTQETKQRAHGEIRRDLTRAVVLAGGRGARMRAAAPGLTLEAAQAHIADRGLKGLVPFHGQPFLAYVLTSLADAGYTDVCLVTAPGADPIREYFEGVRTRRLRIDFAVQQSPLGSAHALLAAEWFSGGDDIAVINSDNLYPAAALRALRDLTGSGLIGFRRDGLLTGNIAAERLTGYAIVESDAEGTLRNITEKPDDARLVAAGALSLVSMTCWRFGPSIFDAIRETPRSVRGELEIPDAVRLAMRRERFELIPLSMPVLDLSQREDIPRVGALLRGRSVDL